MKSFLMKIDGTVVSVKVYLKPADEVTCHTISLHAIVFCHKLVYMGLFVGSGTVCCQVYHDVEVYLSSRSPQPTPLSDVDQVGV